MLQLEGSIRRRRPLAGTATAVLAALTLLAALALAPSPAAAAVPDSFHGVVTQTELTDDDIAQLRDGRVGTLRFVISWETVEAQPGVYDFSGIDRFMRATAEAGVRPLPFVYGTPAWAGPSQPIGKLLAGLGGRLAWQRLLVALTERYGEGGYFWELAGLPDDGVPIWQLGNEPNLLSFWGGRPSPAGYARLLGIGADAIRSVDPGAEIAMAGLPPGTKGPDGWDYLDDLLAIKGVGADFDYIAPHPYSAGFSGVRRKLDQFRRVLTDHGLRGKRMLVTEIGWMAGGPRDNLLRRSKRGQAKILAELYQRLAAKRRRWGIDGVLWFAWRDQASQEDICSFCAHSGLFDAGGRSKPAWAAFKRSAQSLRR